MAESKRPATRQIASNRRAQREYEILESFEAGMVLQGTEVKAARAGKVQLKDSYVEIRDNEAFLVNAHISPYSHGNITNHEPERARKLLLNRREIDKIMGRTTMQGLTCVPLSVYLKGNRIKVQIALARGKKLWDKRQDERRKVLDQEAAEAMKGSGR